MSNEWLAAEGFERAHEIVSAINTLSIHTKLKLAGVDDSKRVEAANRARQQLQSFVSRFGTLVQTIEAAPDAPVLGVDPGMGLLARGFVTGRSQWPPPTLLHTVPLERFSHLLSAQNPDEQRQLVEYLRSLRSLVEQNAHSDIIGILGDL